jgi:glucokinase
MVLFLAGDIGGTNTRLQLVRAASGKVSGKEWEKGVGEVLIAEDTYPSKHYPTLESVIENFLKKSVPAGEQVYCMCLAVAGPVTDNVAAVTNLTWKIDGAALTRQFRLPGRAILINDFVGIGYGLLALDNTDLEVVYKPPPSVVLPSHASSIGVKAVIGAGTGLGECYLTHNGQFYDVWGSEGGHADFAPRNQTEWEIFQHIMKTTKHSDGTPIERCSIERVTSGSGLPKIYEYLSMKYPQRINREAAQKISQADDVGKVISEYARNGKCSICVETFDLFCQTYGAEAGNLSIKTLPFGGLYIAGGIAAKNMDALRKNQQFVQNFLDKGRMRSQVLEKIPIYLITHPSVGLLGSKVMCRRMVREAQTPIRSKL